MREGARYPSPHCADHLGGDTLYILSPHKIKRPVLFKDKVRVEPIMSPDLGHSMTFATSNVSNHMFPFSMYSYQFVRAEQVAKYLL